MLNRRYCNLLNQTLWVQVWQRRGCSPPALLALFCGVGGRLLPFFYSLQKDRSETGLWDCPGPLRVMEGVFWLRGSLARVCCRSPGYVSSLSLTPSMGPLSVSGPVRGEGRELSLAGSINIISVLSSLTSTSVAWEVAISGPWMAFPALICLGKVCLCLAVHCLNSCNLFRPQRGEETQ